MTEHTLTYWTQPYPKTMDEARYWREALRLGVVPYDPHAGTFANESATRAPFSFVTSYRKARA